MVIKLKSMLTSTLLFGKEMIQAITVEESSNQSGYGILTDQTAEIQQLDHDITAEPKVISGCSIKKRRRREIKRAKTKNRLSFSRKKFLVYFFV